MMFQTQGSSKNFKSELLEVGVNLEIFSIKNI